MPSPAPPPPIHVPHAPLAAFLSYLVPGLGQIYQGRVAKGVLFFVCVYGLFFYGMALGSGSNVYLSDSSKLPNPEILVFHLNGGWPKDLWYRPQFVGQFWVGVVAWPAIVQNEFYDPERTTGPLFGGWMRAPYEWRKGRGGDYQRGEPLTPGAPADWPGKTLNELQTDGDKSWDLGWVYTVIAGVLNIMIIYDAYAGPAFVPGPAQARDPREGTAKHGLATAAAHS